MIKNVDLEHGHLNLDNEALAWERRKSNLIVVNFGGGRK